MSGYPPEYAPYTTNTSSKNVVTKVVWTFATSVVSTAKVRMSDTLESNHLALLWNVTLVLSTVLSTAPAVNSNVFGAAATKPVPVESYLVVNMFSIVVNESGSETKSVSNTMVS